MEYLKSTGKHLPLVLLLALVCMMSTVIARQNNVEGSEVVSDESVSQLTMASFWVFVVYVLMATGMMSWVLFNTKNQMVHGMGGMTYTFLVIALSLFASAYGISQNYSNDPESMEISNQLVKASFAFIVFYSVFVLTTIYMGYTESDFIRSVGNVRSRLPYMSNRWAPDMELSFFGRRRKSGRKH